MAKIMLFQCKYHRNVAKGNGESEIWSSSASWADDADGKASEKQMKLGGLARNEAMT